MMETKQVTNQQIKDKGTRVKEVLGKRDVLVRTTMPVIEVYMQNNGRSMYYPNNDAAKLLVEIMGKKVIDGKHLPAIKRLGFKIMQVPNPNLQESKEL